MGRRFLIATILSVFLFLGYLFSGILSPTILEKVGNLPVIIAMLSAFVIAFSVVFAGKVGETESIGFAGLLMAIFLVSMINTTLFYRFVDGISEKQMLDDFYNVSCDCAPSSPAMYVADQVFRTALFDLPEIYGWSLANFEHDRDSKFITAVTSAFRLSLSIGLLAGGFAVYRNYTETSRRLRREIETMNSY